MRLSIQSSGVSRLYVAGRSSGMTPQEFRSSIATPTQLGSILQFKLPSRWKFTKTCCAYSRVTAQLECVTQEVSPFDICECSQTPPPFDLPIILCRPRVIYRDPSRTGLLAG